MAVTVDKVSASTAAFIEASKQADVERKRLVAVTTEAFDAIQASAVLATVPETARGWVTTPHSNAPGGCGVSTQNWVESRFEVGPKAEPQLSFNYSCGDRFNGFFNNRVTLNKSSAITMVTQSPAVLDTVGAALDRAKADLKPYVGAAKPAVIVVVEK